jgi:cell wall-associated NlpC family hydrolase
MPQTIEATIAKFQSFIEKPRTALPWLKNRQSIQDCAAGFSYVSGLKPEIISCSKIKAACVANHTWATKGIPQRGDAIIFDWNGRKTDTAHVGIVLSANKQGVTYVSANSGTHHTVTNNTVGYKYVTGWGRPKAYQEIPATA